MNKKTAAVLAIASFALVGCGTSASSKTVTASSSAPAAHSHPLTMAYCDDIQPKDQCLTVVAATLKRGITTIEEALPLWEKNQKALDDTASIMDEFGSTK